MAAITVHDVNDIHATLCLLQVANGSFVQAHTDLVSCLLYIPAVAVHHLNESLATLCLLQVAIAILVQAPIGVVS